MTLNFQKKLVLALNEIDFKEEYHEFIVHEQEEILDKERHVDFLDKYGEAKWGVVEILNSRYSTILNDKFDLYHWLNHNTRDEVAYFLSEAGANCLNYSLFRAPHKFHLWLGANGFVIGIGQKGKGFSAVEVEKNNIRTHEGAAFDFFRKCNSEIFFDDANSAKVVYLKAMF